MFPAARLTDPITHDLATPCGVIGAAAPVPCPRCASNLVMIEGLPAAHVGCTVACTGVVAGGLAHPPMPLPPTIVKGSTTVYIHGQPAARWFPAADFGACAIPAPPPPPVPPGVPPPPPMPPVGVPVSLGNPALAATRTVLVGG